MSERRIENPICGKSYSSVSNERRKKEDVNVDMNGRNDLNLLFRNLLVARFVSPSDSVNRNGKVRVACSGARRATRWKSPHAVALIAERGRRPSAAAS